VVGDYGHGTIEGIWRSPNTTLPRELHERDSLLLSRSLPIHNDYRDEHRARHGIRKNFFRKRAYRSISILEGWMDGRLRVELPNSVLLPRRGRPLLWSKRLACA
jgi:hypothetical protein